MTCVLHVTALAEKGVSYWVPNRPACLEWADLWRWACQCGVWMEAFL